ncbi:Uncharacterised protein [Mycobacteroides abscessus subsp. abscessus]|nr:Uncharacterised protein [Mycobacteroides abscessus subsp. abscessus]
MHDLGEAGESARSEVLDLPLHPRELVSRCFNQSAFGSVRNCLQQNEIAQPLE